MLNEVLVVVGSLVGLIVSCVVAQAASGGRASPAWGLLGPAGWIVAACRGIQEAILEGTRPPASAGPAPDVSMTVKCPQCGKSEQFPRSWRGISVQCSGCRTGWRLPK